MAVTQVKGKDIGDKSITEADIELSLVKSVLTALDSLVVRDVSDGLLKKLLTSVLTTYLDTLYQSKNADLTAIAAITATEGLLKKTSNGSYELDTKEYLAKNQGFWKLANWAETWISYGTGFSTISGIAISNTNKYVLCCASTTIKASSDYGVTWTSTVVSTGILRFPAMSYDGKYQTACDSVGYVFKSSDYGTTWTSQNISGGYLRIVAMSYDGKYQTACDTTGYVFKSSDYGATWTSQNISGGILINLAMSYDGKYQTASNTTGYIFKSSDYGATWTSQNISGGSMNGMAISANGKYQIASNTTGYVFKSSDYGTTWTSQNLGVSSLRCIAISYYGDYIITASGVGVILKSTDYGATWTSIAYTTSSTMYIAMSKDARYTHIWSVGDSFKLSVADVSFGAKEEGRGGSEQWNAAYGWGNHADAGYALNSALSEMEASNLWGYGSFSGNCTTFNIGATPISIAMSADGKTMAGIDVAANVFVSSDYGVTWNSYYTGNMQFYIAMSADGNIIARIDGNGNILVSSDYGVTWNSYYTGNMQFYIAMSADGKTMAGIDGYGYVYVSSDYGVNWNSYYSEELPSVAISVSADGKTLAGINVYGNVFVSSNYGVNWNSYSIGATPMYFAMSADGKTMATAETSGNVFVSSDYGVNWNSYGIGGTLSSLAMSADGKTLVGINGYGYVYVSSDYGVNWNLYGIGGTPISFAMSADGKTLTVVDNTNIVRVSYDYGVNWNSYSIGATPISFAMSADGKTLAITDSNGNVNVFLAKLATTREIEAKGGNSTQWNEAYNRGDHALAGYATTAALEGYATTSNLSAMQADIDSKIEYGTEDMTPANAVAASAVLNLTGLPADGDWVCICGLYYYFRTTISQAYDVLIGTDVEDTITNLLYAVQDASVFEGVKYGTGTDINSAVTGSHQITHATFVAKVKGAVANDFVVARSGVNINWNGSQAGSTYLAGGIDGTVGKKGQTNLGGAYQQRLYICIADNTIYDSNWRYILLTNY